MDLAVLPTIYFHCFLVRNVGIPEARIFVAPSDLLAVGRPHGLELEALITAGNLLLLTHPVIRSDVDLVLTGAVRDVGDPASIR